MKLELFKGNDSLVNLMFKNTQKYLLIPRYDRGRNRFIINRMFAIKFPTQSEKLNRSGINETTVVDLWQTVAAKFKNIPSWFYTKTKASKTNIKKWEPNKEILKLWLKNNKMSQKDFNDLLKFYPDDIKSEFENIEQRIKMY